MLVCATLAACALAAPRVVGDDVRAVPSVPRGVGERSVSKGKLSCGECELIVSLAQKIGACDRADQRAQPPHTPRARVQPRTPRPLSA